MAKAPAPKKQNSAPPPTRWERARAIALDAAAIGTAIAGCATAFAGAWAAWRGLLW